MPYEHFQPTGPYFFCGIVFGMTALLAWAGAWKAFFEEYKEPTDS